MYKLTLTQQKMGTHGAYPERVSFMGNDIFELTALVERLSQLKQHETEYLIEKVGGENNNGND